MMSRKLEILESVNSPSSSVFRLSAGLSDTTGTKTEARLDDRRLAANPSSEVQERKMKLVTRTRRYRRELHSLKKRTTNKLPTIFGTREEMV